MKNLLFNKWTFAILALLIGLGLGYCTRENKAHNPQGTSIVTKTERIDSIVYVPKPYPVYYTKTVIKPVPYYIDTLDTIPQASCNKKKYKTDVLLEPKLKLTYDATVHGILDTIEFSLEDKRPEKVVYSTTLIETHVTHKPKGLYLGGAISTQGIGPAATYIQDKHAFGAQYDFISKRPTLSYQFKPF